MQRLRDTFRRRQNTLEAQAKAEASKIQQQQQRQTPNRSPHSTPTHAAAGGQTSSRSPTNSTFDEVWMGEPSPPMSPARNETSLSFGSNPSNEDIEEEDEEDNDEFDLNMSGLTLNESMCRQYLSELCPESSSKKMCLEVPNQAGLDADVAGKQMRSASFDESRSRDNPGGSNLNVPDANMRSMRSRSFDYAAAPKTPETVSKQAARKQQQFRGARNDSTTSGQSIFLDVPKWKLLIRRPSSSSHSTASDTGVKDCIHCALLDELNRTGNLTPTDSIDSECSSYNEDDEKDVQMDTADQETVEENKAEDSGNIPKPVIAVDEFLIDEYIEPIEGLPIVTFCPPEVDSPSRDANEEDTGSGITVISLEVPVLSGSKQARSASVDSPYLLQVPKRTDIEVREGPPKARSKSVDIVLPTNPGGPYLIVPPLHQPPITTKKTIQGEIKIQAENGETRVLRSAPDWTESAINADHLWVSTSTSGSDLCYVGERECSKTGPRLCCPACKVTAHTGCISTLIDKLKIHCKPTFKDGVRQYREQPFVKHHWVHRRHEKGRCKACGKSFQSKLSFGGNKEIVAISCSWCKAAFHNKSQCYTEQLLAEPCDFGNYAQIIVPPTWIVKLPRKGSFKSSIRRAPRNKRLSSKRRSKKQEQSAVNPVVPGANVTLSVGSPLASSGDKLNCSGSSTASSTTIASLGSSCSGSPSSVILSLQQAQSENVAETPSPFLGQHNGALHHGHPAHFAHSPHYYSKHNQPESMYANSTTSGPGRRQYRRHSHAAVSASSLTSGLLSAESKDGQLSYPHPTTTSHFLHTVHRSFAIKPIPSANLKPLLVFINPKSGGNQGAKLMQKFQWHLNPRQVFDLSQGGPRLGLDLYKKVHNLRVLACGGDGTAGWVLSTIDEIGIQPPPPIAVLPLGTGNDLARSINWGGSYTDEPVSKILCNIQDGEVVQLDRWNLKVQRNVNVPGHILIEESKGQAKPELPLNVVNNYFSIGVDAHIALSFHEAREAHPERFNSRLRNRMFYGQAGGKDLMQRKWKDLSHYVTLECDGVDYTWRLKELKVHSVLFLNIPSYSGGTRPWAQSSSYEPQSTNDGKIEVIGLTTYQLPLLQAGGHGTCIAQCQSAKIITTRTIPMQVDGEPCRLLPSLIHLELRNKANLIAKTKSIIQHRQMPTLEKITLKVRKLNLVDYETYHYDKDRLKDLSTLLGAITIEQNLELIHVRTRINDLMKEKGLFVVGASDCTSSQTLASLAAQVDPNASPSKISPTNISLPSTSFSSPAFVSSSSVSNKFVSNDWCFVDSCTAERFFRIDRAQEHLHYVVDICNEDLYILDPQFEEKDEIDLLTSEEVIADFGGNGGSSAGDETDQGNASSMLADSDQQSDIPSVDSLPSRFPNEMPSLLQLNGSTTANYSSTAPKSGEVSKLSLPGLSADGTQQAGSSQLSDLDASPNSLAVTPELGSKFPNHNGSLGLSPLSPQPYSIDSPPRSPRRGQKMPQSYLLQDQLISAAQTGDVSLLKQLHHKGVNLMKADENQMTALHHAAINGHENAVSFLLNAFTPDMLDLADRASGHTALHCAVLAGHRNICTMLAIRGATLSVKDHQGRSAQDLAHYLGQHDLAAALSHLSSANNRETTV